MVRYARKGFSLSINMIVVLILGVVLVSMGIVLVNRLVSEGVSLDKQISDRLMEQLRRSHFHGGSLVAVLNPSLKVRRGDEAWFLLGFRNELGAPHTFIVNVVFDSAVLRDPSLPLPSESVLNDLVLHSFKNPSFVSSLDPNDDDFYWIVFSPPKDLPPGQYMYDVYVCVNSPYSSAACGRTGYEVYGQKQRLFITVI